MARKSSAVEPPHQSKKIRDQEEAFHLIKILAYSLIAAIFAASATLQSSAFLSMWRAPQPTESLAIFALRITLFVALVALVVMWIGATESELELWIRELEIPYVRSEIYGAMFGLAVILGLFFVFVYNIVLISGFLGFYFLFNYWTQWLANNHFERALRLTRGAQLSEEHSEVLKVMERYWLRRPQLGRLTTMMFFSMVAFSLAVAGAQQTHVADERWQSWAYGVLILTLVVGESTVTYWRHVRDRDIESITDGEDGAGYANTLR